MATQSSSSKATDRLNQQLVQKINDLVSNYDFKGNFEKEFSQFSREHEKDSMDESWNTKVNKMSDSDFLVEGLKYREKQAKNKQNEDEIKNLKMKQLQNEISKKLIAQKIAIDHKDVQLYEQLQNYRAEECENIEKNEFLDKYIDEQEYAKNIKKDQFMEEDYKFDYSEYANEYWEDFDEDVQPLRNNQGNNIQENIKQEFQENEKNQEQSEIAKKPSAITMLEQKDKKYSEYKRQTYIENLQFQRQQFENRIRILKKGMKIQLRFGRQQARQKAKVILMDSVSNLTYQFRKELDSLLDSFQFYKNEMRLQDKKIKDMQQVMKDQEEIIIQLNNYISHAGLILTKDKDELQRLKNEKKALIRKGKHQASEIFNQHLSSIPEFKLYSFYVSATLNEDRNQQVHNEVVRILNLQINELQEQLEQKIHDVTSFNDLQEVYDIRENELRKRVAILESTLAEKELIIEQQNRKINGELMVELNSERAKKEDFENKLRQCLTLTDQEISVNEKIRAKQERIIEDLKKEIKELKTILRIPRLRNAKMDQLQYDELMRLKSQGQGSDLNTLYGLTEDLNEIDVHVMSAPALTNKQRIEQEKRQNQFFEATISSDLKKKMAKIIYSQSNSSKGFETERGSVRQFPLILKNKDEIVKKILNRIDHPNGSGQSKLRNEVTAVITNRGMTPTRNRSILMKDSLSYSQLPSIYFNFDSLQTTNDASKMTMKKDQ